MRGSLFKGVVLGSVCSALVFVASSALAGSGIGGVFNLGVSNTVDARTSLSGAASQAQLAVANTNTGGGAFGITANNASTGAPAIVGVNSSSGVGVKGASTSGPGVVAQSASASQPALQATNTGGGPAGQFSGAGTAVAGSSTGNLTIGVKGSNNANPGYGVWGESKLGTGVYGIGGNYGGYFKGNGGGLGTKTSGYGVFATSANGPALGLSQGSGNPAPPVTLNGAPFPSATDAYQTGDSDLIPNDQALHTLETLSLPAGDYALLAKGLMVNLDQTPLLPGLAAVNCMLVAGGDSDKASAILQGPGGLIPWEGGPTIEENFALTVFHHFDSAGTATIQCETRGVDVDHNGPHPIYLGEAKIMAIRVSGGSNIAALKS